MTGLLELPNQSPEVPRKMRLVGHELSTNEIADFQKKRTHYLLERNLIRPDDLQDGLMPDHFSDRSIWIGVDDPDRCTQEAAGRIILTDGKSVDSLQMRLDNIKNPDLELIEAIRKHDPRAIGEVASLLQVGENPLSVLHVYAGLKHVSDMQGIRYWVFGLRRRNEATFKRVFGNALHTLGDSVEIDGAQEDLAPYLINIDEGVRDLRESLNGELDRFTQKMRETFIEALDAYGDDHSPVAA